MKKEMNADTSDPFNPTEGGGIKFGMPYRVDKRKAPEISDPGAFSQQILSQYQEDHGFTHA